MSRPLHLALALFLVLVTGLSHALAGGDGCTDTSGGVHASSSVEEVDDCCDPPEGAASEPDCADTGCEEGCTFCVCCPARTAITTALPAPPAATLVSVGVTFGYRNPVLAAAQSDIFQPPRA